MVLPEKATVETHFVCNQNTSSWLCWLESVWCPHGHQQSKATSLPLYHLHNISMYCIWLYMHVYAIICTYIWFTNWRLNREYMAWMCLDCLDRLFVHCITSRSCEMRIWKQSVWGQSLQCKSILTETNQRCHVMSCHVSDTVPPLWRLDMFLVHVGSVFFRHVPSSWAFTAHGRAPFECFYMACCGFLGPGSPFCMFDQCENMWG